MRSREKSMICSAFIVLDYGPLGSIYAGICTDMQRVRHFWRKVPEIREAGSSG